MTRVQTREPITASVLCQAPVDGGQPCAEPFARLYFVGLRCAYHAPKESEIRAHAAARYRHRRGLR